MANDDNDFDNDAQNDTDNDAKVDHGEPLEIDKRDADAAKGDQTPLQMRDVPDDLIPDADDAGYVSSGIDPAHVQQPETQDNVPKGTLPGV